ncbi:MAG: AI-2E family transporter [Emticicia sp.]|uniref:AI-2E family transporter n=1 Tax=Emticicia sp. TaxID=1930953 RepID=UPI003BA681E9
MTITLNSVIKKLLLLFLVIAGLYFGKVFLMPLCFGAVLATLFLPLSNWLQHRKIPKFITVIFCLLTIILVVGGLVSLFGWKISGLIKDVELLKQRAIDTGIQLQTYIFNRFGVSAEEQLQILKKEQPSYANLMQSMAGSVSSFFGNLILVYIYFIFLLYYRNHIKQFLLRLSTEKNKAEMEQIIQSTTKVSQQYLLGLLKMIACLWIMYGIGFSILGVEDAIFFAILCGFLEIVPYVGNITGTLLTVFVAALHGAELSMLGGIVVVYGIVQTIQGWLLEPIILGPQVKINPLFTIFALVIGQLIWGVSGIILAIPLTAILKIIFDHIEPLKPYGFLVGEIESDEAEPGFAEKIKNKILSVRKK